LDAAAAALLIGPCKHEA